MAGEEAGHDGVERGNAGLEKRMGAVTKERPCVTGSAGIDEHLFYPFQEAVFVDITSREMNRRSIPPNGDI